MTNRFEKRKQRTRAHLKQAAADLLLEKGYTDLTIQDITDRADFARGTFYVHFTDKDEIIWSILRDSMDDLVAETLNGLVDVPYMERKLALWVRVFEYAAEHRELLTVLLGEKGHPGFVTQLQDFFAAVISEGIERGVFRPHVDVPTDFAAQYMTGALVRLMLWSLDTDYPPAALAEMFFKVVFGHEPD